MTDKSLSSLTLDEIKTLGQLFNSEDDFLLVPRNNETDENIPLVYECLILNLRVLEEHLKNGVKERFEDFADYLETLLPLTEHANDIILEIKKSGSSQRHFLSKLFYKEVNQFVKASQKNLTELLCESYLYHPHFAEFKKKFPNRLDFDILLEVVLYSNLLGSYFINKHSNDSDYTPRLSHIVSTLCKVYPRLDVLERVQPDNYLFIEGILDYYSNYDHPEVSLSNETIKRLFKFNNFSSSRPHYEVFDSTVKMDDVVLPAEILDHIRSLCLQHKTLSDKSIKNRLTFLFKGPPGTGKTHCAHAIANFLGLKIINVHLNEHSADKHLPSRVLGLMRRAEAKNCVLLFDECEDVLGYNPFTGNSDSWAKKLFETFQGVAIFTTNHYVPYGFDRRVNYMVELRHPDALARATILKKEADKLVDQKILSVAPSREALLQVSKDYTVAGGYYSQILKLAASISTPSDIIDPDKLKQAFDHISGNIQNKGQQQQNDEIRLSKIKLADVKLPKVLQEEAKSFINYAKEILNKKVTHPLLPKGATAIFTGLPGTGKTILAEALASELGLMFRRASPSTFLSKWVGETEGNIKKVFKDAEKEKYLLFIDEAEGIFLDRKGADRSWEKTQVDELLQQLEDFKGVLIIATNFKDMIDEAFARRFVFHFAFEIPDFETRKELWAVWQNEFKFTSEDLEKLAKDFEFTGGEIRNLAVQYKIRGGEQGMPCLLKLCEQALNNRTGKTKRKIGLT